MAGLFQAGVLPQYAGTAYGLSQQQMLAQALMRNAMQGQQLPATVGSGGSQNYQVAPRVSLVGGLAQMGQGALGGAMMSNVAQGMNNLGAAQWQYLTGGNPYGGGSGASAPMGGNASPLSQPPAGQPANGGTAGGVASGADVSGSSAAQSAGAAPGVAPQQGFLAPGGSMNPGGMPINQAAMQYLTLGPEEYSKEFVAPYYQPTDIVRNLRAAGIDPNSTFGRQIMQQQIAKMNYIAPVSIRANGGIYNPATGGITMLPSAAPAGYQAVQDPQTGQWGYQPVQGGPQAVTASEQARQTGKTFGSPTEVYSPNADGQGHPGMVRVLGSDVYGQPGQAAPAAPANPALPAPLRNNNPGALMPDGKLTQYPDMQAGLAALDNNLVSYGKQGVNTLAGVISKWAPPNENNTQAYIQDVSQRLGLSPNQKIDLSKPAVRQAIATGIMLHENGPSAVFATGAPTAGAMAAPPLGAVPAANAAQSAAPESMQKDYESMLEEGPQTQQALDALNKMMQLGAQKSAAAVGPIGAYLGETGLSTNAAEYDKQRANVIALLGKSLGGTATDAARANIGQSIPDYGKPKAAIQEGIQTQINQLNANLLRRQVLTGAYNSGNSGNYTALANGFDQNIKPSMMPVLGLSGPAQRAAVQAAVKANPAMRANYQWAYEHGLLK